MVASQLNRKYYILNNNNDTKENTNNFYCTADVHFIGKCTAYFKIRRL